MCVEKQNTKIPPDLPGCQIFVFILRGCSYLILLARSVTMLVNAWYVMYRLNIELLFSLVLSFY